MKKNNLTAVEPEEKKLREESPERERQQEERTEADSPEKERQQEDSPGEERSQQKGSGADSPEKTRPQEKNLNQEKSKGKKQKEKKPETNHPDQNKPKTTNPDRETASKDAEGITEIRAKRHGFGKVIAFLCLAVLLITGIAYVGIGFYYRTHFLPNTVVNDIAVSGMKVPEAAQLLDAWVQSYALEVTGRDPATAVSHAILGKITPEDVGLVYTSSEKALSDLLRNQNWLLWINAWMTKEPQSKPVERGSTSLDEERLKELVSGWDACQPSRMIPARDAYIGEYDPEKEKYEIVPEVQGTEFDVDQVIRRIRDTLLDLNGDTLDLEEEDLYVQPRVSADDKKLVELVDTANLWLSTDITYDWNGNQVVLDAETISEWVTIENGKVSLDEDAVASFVRAQARKYDTYGKTKTFVTTSGVELSLPSASYGWKTDRETETEELCRLIRDGSTEPREPVYIYKGMIKTKDSVNDIGTSYVEADLTNQHLYLYLDGVIVLETDFVSGKVSNGNSTPAGIFGITYKTTNAVLRGANYETPVNYWMPFYGNYGMHDATWRASFGGDIFLNNGSHGCINLPLSSAEQIYGYVYSGFPVICYYYDAPLAPEGEEFPDPETGLPETAPVQQPVNGE